MKLSIIIVNYNTKAEVISCLKSISLADVGMGPESEVIVVDNNSTDGSVSAIESFAPWVKLIRNNENLGFAKANNRAIGEAKGEYILLLNPDTEVLPGTIDKILAFMDNHPEIAVATCWVELGNGKLDPACHRGFPTPWASFCYFSGLERLFPKSRWFGQYHLTYKSLAEPHEIDTPSGCFYLVRREIIKRVGLLDEAFFLYGEDVDWSYRIKKMGGKIYFYPEAKIIHYKGSSSGVKRKTGAESKAEKATKIKAINSFYDAMKIFYDKHYKDRYFFLIRYLVYLGISIKRIFSLWRLRV